MSASLIIIVSSLCKFLIALDYVLFKFGLNMLFVLVFGKSSFVEINLSRLSYLSGGGIKLLLFLTNEMSVSSVPSKYSTSLNLLNSFKS